jgi:hypothetical protein
MKIAPQFGKVVENLFPYPIPSNLPSAKPMTDHSPIIVFNKLSMVFPYSIFNSLYPVGIGKFLS